METIDVKAIIAAATQAATVATFNLLKEQGIIIDEPNAKVVSPKPKAKPTKRLPDSKSATISDILSDAKEEARENGTSLFIRKDKELIIMEYSERSYAVAGDTKQLKDLLKANGAYRYGVIWGFANNTAKGWLIKKKEFDKAFKGLTEFQQQMQAEQGYRVTIGESLKAINEAYKAEHPREEKEEKQTKIVPVKSKEIEFFEGIGYTPKGVVRSAEDRGIAKYPFYENLYVIGNSFYMCIGSDNGENNFLFVAGGNIENDKQKMERIATIAKVGLPQAYDKGIVKKVYQWQMDAYKVADKESYNWLKSHVKEVSA